MAERRRTAVIGGGMAGCAAARELLRAGREVVLFEASDGLAGRARSWHTPELESDTGLSMWIMSCYRETLTLVGEYGLQDELESAPIEFQIVHEGRAGRISAESVGTLFSYPHLGVVDKLRLFAATGADLLRRKQLDMFEPELLAAFDDGSTGADWARRAISQRGLDNFVRAEIESLWLWRCEEVSAAHVRATHAQLTDAKLYFLRHGMEVLAERMVAGVDVRLNREVTGIEPVGPGGRLRIAVRAAVDGGARVEEAEQEVDEVVIATTADVAAKLSAALPTHQVSAEARQFLESQRYEPVMLVTFLTDPGQMPPDALFIGTGDGPHPMRIIVTQPVRVLGPDGAFHDRMMTCGMPGRGETAALLELPDEQVYQRARELMPRLWPAFPESAESFHVLREPQAMPWPEPGRFRAATRIIQGQRGPIVLAGDCFCSPTTEAAIRSGLRAARTLTGQR